MDFPKDDTGQVLAQMHDAGIDLTQPHEVVFFHLFESKEQAQAMAEHLQQLFPEFSLHVHEDETPNVWDVDCTINMVPSYQLIMNKEAELEQLATKFSGYNDGWGIEA